MISVETWKRDGMCINWREPWSIVADSLLKMTHHNNHMWNNYASTIKHFILWVSSSSFYSFIVHWYMLPIAVLFIVQHPRDRWDISRCLRSKEDTWSCLHHQEIDLYMQQQGLAIMVRNPNSNLNNFMHYNIEVHLVCTAVFFLFHQQVKKQLALTPVEIKQNVTQLWSALNIFVVLRYISIVIYMQLQWTNH